LNKKNSHHKISNTKYVLFKTVTRNAIANGIGFLVEAIVAFCMMPFVVHRIGDTAYGIWALIISLSGYMSFLKIGLRPAVNKYVAQYREIGETKKLQELIETCLLIYIACGALIIVTGFFLFFKAGDIFHINAKLRSTTSWLALLASFQVAFSLVAVVFGGIISGCQRYDINNAIEISVILCRTALILIFLPIFPTILSVAIPHFVVTGISYMVTARIGKRMINLPPLRIFKKPSREIWSTVSRFASITFLISLIGTLMTEADAVLSGMIITTAAITQYAVGARLVKYTERLLQLLANVLAPASSQLNARNDKKQLQTLFRYTVKMSSAIAIAILLCFLVQGKEFIRLWMGPGYETAYLVMAILSAGAILALPQQSVRPFLYGLARHKIIMYIYFVEAAISLPLAWLLGRKLGLTGIAIGLTVPKALTRGTIYPVYGAQLMGIRFGSFFLDSYLKICLASFPFIASLSFFKHIHWLARWDMFIFQLIISTIIYIFSIWMLAFNRYERQHTIDLIKQHILHAA